MSQDECPAYKTEQWCSQQFARAW